MSPVRSNSVIETEQDTLKSAKLQLNYRWSVSVSLLDEKTRSHGTAEAWTGMVSSGNLM